MKFFDFNEDEKDFDFLWLSRSAKTICQQEYNNRSKDTNYMKLLDIKGWSNAKEAVFKLIHHHSIGSNKLFNYVTDPEKVQGSDKLFNYLTNPEKSQSSDLLFNDFGFVTDRETIKEKVSDWNQINRADHRIYQERCLDREKSGQEPRKTKPRYTTHMIFSVNEKPSKKSILALQSAVADVQNKYLTGLGYDSYFVIHKNTDNLHAHLVVQNKNLITDQRIDFSKAVTWCMKKDFAECLNKYGLNYKSTSKKKESLEAKNSLSKEQRKDNDHFTHQVVKKLGKDSKLFVKKQLIEAKSKDPKKADKAKTMITLMQNLHDPAVLSSVRSSFEEYKEQRKKYDVKKTLIAKYPDVEESDIKRYVDILYAKKTKLLQDATTKNKSSIQALEKHQKILDHLPEIDENILIRFSIDIRKKKRIVDSIGKFSHYGIPGQQYLYALTKDIKKLDPKIDKKSPACPYLKRSLLLQQEAKQLFSKKLKPEDVLTRLKTRNIGENHQFFKRRIEALHSHFSDLSNGTYNKKIIDDIATLYLVKRTTSPESAYKFYTMLISDYQKFVKSNDKNNIKILSNFINDYISVNPPSYEKEKSTPGFS